MRDRLVVVAPRPVEAVRFAGGWLFDRVMAGWEAVVFLVDGGDTRPLRILGAYPGELNAGLASSVRVPRPHTIAVDAELYASDARVRRLVRNVLHDGAADVRFWGDSWPADLDGCPSVQHQLSVAARAFKAQALAAAAAPADSVAVTETFRTGEPPRVRPAPDLVSAS